MTVRVKPKNYKTYEDFMAKMSGLRNYLISKNAAMAAGTVKAEGIIQDSVNLARHRDQTNEFLVLPDIVQDVKDYEKDQTYDISVATGPTLTELQNAIDLIASLLPVDIGDLVNGYWVSRTFTPQNTEPVRAAYQLVTDTIAAE